MRKTCEIKDIADYERVRLYANANKSWEVVGRSPDNEKVNIRYVENGDTMWVTGKMRVYLD